MCIYMCEWYLLLITSNQLLYIYEFYPNFLNERILSKLDMLESNMELNRCVVWDVLR